MELMETEMTESEKEFYQGNKIKQELWTVLIRFYKKNTIFNQENLVLRHVDIQRNIPIYCCRFLV